MTDRNNKNILDNYLSTQGSYNNLKMSRRVQARHIESKIRLKKRLQRPPEDIEALEAILGYFE